MMQQALNPDSFKVQFEVPGVPVPKGRPRARIIKPHYKEPFISFYTPAETERYEKLVRDYASIAMAGKVPLDCACQVIVQAFIPISESWSLKKIAKALNGELLPISKPDSDNYGKLVCDAMNKIVYFDDSRVCRMIFEKHYSDNPRLKVCVTEISGQIV